MVNVIPRIQYKYKLRGLALGTPPSLLVMIEKNRKAPLRSGLFSIFMSITSRSQKHVLGIYI